MARSKLNPTKEKLLNFAQKICTSNAEPWVRQSIPRSIPTSAGRKPWLKGDGKMHPGGCICDIYRVALIWISFVYVFWIPMSCHCRRNTIKTINIILHTIHSICITIHKHTHTHTHGAVYIYMHGSAHWTSCWVPNRWCCATLQPPKNSWKSPQIEFKNIRYAFWKGRHMVWRSLKTKTTVQLIFPPTGLLSLLGFRECQGLPSERL